MRKMDKEMWKDGGVFDQFAGDDARMSIDEARKMNDVIRKGAADFVGEEIPGYSDDEFAAMYKAWNSLSEGDGFTKTDMMTAQGIMDRFRDARISPSEIDKFYPMTEVVYYEWLDEIDQDGETYKHWLNSVENGFSKEENKA